ncbi:MAG: Histidine triad (HIT) hydrolase-like protein [Parcubacteria group bacterium GW2011_GWC1_42_11]|uniref:Histidine triad (HIT) hydrolase-like protein n=1 Tax=Candidatus Nomurabacteria bacterium GW2011_GWC2_42_20 TaxID=1618756 RepID=A0A0G1CB90_9BACT|nr:MAG: Histidine triad (HIT) hydrolase-like protein [Parcubacteria group bacterium GW2011_GWC1_42_11]KKS46913.1 MAG: Histidine triad (HIT) hydrolase-like protein [Candidatus Nomurabacteria bacterium GW2011_GWC2_42_20]KKS58918.1 MAG: Histidine triad (HIT) hydrolase-like protein [Candidatus Nomurabacteria bacterium GW2011_GWA2_42_41]KKT08130.1 MAG: Histidine triad (HIT) hydrolase-like protein [Candidatus Nomurabacteria bacterium GW2011_GWB1_43_20]HBH71295.1 hypothetical protein [Candidatus Yonat
MTLSKDIFCAIATNDAPALIIAENDLAVAFLDREPTTEGHVLIIPKRHADDILDISREEITAVMSLAQHVAIILRNILGYTSVILHQVNGVEAQDIRHFHLHVYGGPNKIQHYYQQFGSTDDLNKALLDTMKKMTQE